MPKHEEEERAEKTFTVPHDSTVEQILVAAALVDREARAKLCKILPHRDRFHTPMFAAAWAYVLELERQKLDHEPALCSRMVGDHVDVGYLGKLLAANPDPPADLGRFVKALLWDDVRVRAAKGPASLFVEALSNPAESPERLRAIARQLAQMFEGGVGAGRYLADSDELVRAQMADLEERIAGRLSYPFGIKILDEYEEGYEDAKGSPLGGTRRMLPGAAPNLITLIAGSTGVGKSTIAAHLALGQARMKRRVLYCAWEPDEGMTLELMACISLKWSRTALIQGRSQGDLRAPMTGAEKVEFQERMHAISRWVTFMRNPFYKGMKPSNEAHLDLFQEHVESSGADFVIADLWERLLVENRPDQEAAALRRQQSMMKQCRAHLCMLGQFNKASGGGEKPTQASVTGSGSWVQVPNNVICPWRPALSMNVEDDTMQLHVVKQRDGAFPQVVECDWDPSRGAISGGKTLPYEAPGREEGSFGDLFGKRRKKKE